MSEPFRFKKEHCLSDRPIDIEIRKVFSEWKETIEFLAEFYAERANELLDEHVASLPEVFGIMLDDNHATDFGYIDFKSRTHRAKLWGVEQLKKEKE